MTNGEKFVLLAHVAMTLFMVGLIWFVQVVHYPLLARVGSDRFTDYEAAHVRLTSWVVGPPMIIEAATAAALVWRPPAPVWPGLCWSGLVLLLLIWASTGLLQVPRHNALATGFDATHHGTLVVTNWARTVAWTLRGGLVLLMVTQAIAGGPADA